MNFKKQYISLVKFIIIIITLAFNNSYSFQKLTPEEDEYNNVRETELVNVLTQIIISYGPQRFEEAIDWLLPIADFNLVTMAINRLRNHHNGSI